MFRLFALFGFGFVLMVFQCQNKKIDKDIFRQIQTVQPEGKTVQERFIPPKGYTRIKVAKGSFPEYLRQLPLLEKNAPVLLYNGEMKADQNIHAAVLDIDVGNRDLQQCADACMRLWAEYNYRKKDFDAIHFNFTNGFYFDYPNWRQGKRIIVKENKVNWYHTGKTNTSYQGFRKYMDLVFSYAGTWSLSQDLERVKPEEIEIGNLFLQAGNPGHAIIILDMATNEKGEKCMLLAQSYMPAQSIHILKNMQELEISPWYRIPKEGVLRTPEWTFTTNDIRKFTQK